MSRRIHSQSLQAASTATPQLDGYFDRIVKYIPGDVLAAWLAAKGILASVEAVPAGLFWIAVALGLLVTLAWTHKQTAQPGQRPAVFQILVSGAAFLIWVAALGGPPFANIPGFEPYMGSLALIAFTVISGLLIPKD